MLAIENSVLVIIDVQGKLSQLMYEKEKLFANLVRMVKASQLLEIPILWNEQYPEGLGATVPELAELLTNQKPMAKMSFGCCGNASFVTELRKLNRRQVLLVGIETHVCVYQSAVELMQMGYEVNLISDAVSSRTPENKRIGMKLIKADGGRITSTETALFELMRTASHPRFRDISRLVK